MIWVAVVILATAAAVSALSDWRRHQLTKRLVTDLTDVMRRVQQLEGRAHCEPELLQSARDALRDVAAADGESLTSADVRAELVRLLQKTKVRTDVQLELADVPVLDELRAAPAAMQSEGYTPYRKCAFGYLDVGDEFGWRGEMWTKMSDSSATAMRAGRPYTAALAARTEVTLCGT